MFPDHQFRCLASEFVTNISMYAMFDGCTYHSAQKKQRLTGRIGIFTFRLNSQVNCSAAVYDHESRLGYKLVEQYKRDGKFFSYSL
jgi:hypothetical protein